jgi:hypothetical protein
MKMPAHEPYRIKPGGAVEIFRTLPVAKLVLPKGVKLYCKYCDGARGHHRNWWLMPRGEYACSETDKAEQFLLCGRCQHVRSIWKGKKAWVKPVVARRD